MSEIETRARDLLVTLLQEQHGWVGALAAEALGESPAKVRISGSDAIKAVAAALTPPEGYVLVPEQLPVEMEVAFMEAWTSKRRCIDDPEMQDAWSAALAARPEVAGG